MNFVKILHGKLYLELEFHKDGILKPLMVIIV